MAQISAFFCPCLSSRLVIILNSTKTYKVITILREKNEASWKNLVKVFSLGNNCWRNIESFIVISFDRLEI